MTVAPELGPLGESRAVMAWIPCSVPAKTRYSFEVSCARPSTCDVNENIYIYKYAQIVCVTVEVGRTGEVTLVDETAGLVDDLPVTTA